MGHATCHQGHWLATAEPLNRALSTMNLGCSCRRRWHVFHDLAEWHHVYSSNTPPVLVDVNRQHKCPGDTKLLFGGDPTVSVTDMRLQKTYILISTCCYSNCSCNHIHRPELKSSQEVSPCFSWTTYLVHEVLWSHHRLPINISSIPRWNLKMFDSSQFLIVIVKILYLKWVTLSFPLFEPPTWHCWSLKFH